MFMSHQETSPLTPEQVVDGYLQVARLVEAGGGIDETERILKTAVAIAIRKTGEDSATTGLALLELWDFYERVGREAEAAYTWDRLATLLVENQQWLLETH